MLSIIRYEQRITLKLSGRLVGSCAEDFRFLTSPGAALDVDLSGLTFVDRAGERTSLAQKTSMEILRVEMVSFE